MGLISIQTGSIMQFADGAGISLPQLSGAPEVFVKKFISGITLGTNGVITVPNTSTISITDGGTLKNSGILNYDYTFVTATINPTSSLINNADWITTGSYIMIRSAGDHTLELGAASNFIGNVIRYSKRDNNSNYIMLSASGVTSPFQINDLGSYSSSDPFAAIEIVGTTSGWRILSKHGTWS